MYKKQVDPMVSNNAMETLNTIYSSPRNEQHKKIQFLTI